MKILDYIHWRGDLSFKDFPLNEVDSLIFSTLCYEDFADLQPQTINQLHDAFFKLHNEEDLKKRKTLTARSYELLKACAYTNRFGNIMVSNYINEIDPTTSSQFSAITFSFNDQFKYIAFRGTDDTIIGWKEDFMFSYKDKTASQQKAVLYLENILKQKKLFKKTTYYVGGHSKGGNLAIYASTKIQDKYKPLIKEVHNFDGPGFDLTFWKDADLSKITSFIPQSGFFGRLLSHQEKNIVIQSAQTGLLQHDPFQWKVDVSELLKAPHFSEGSNKAITRFNELMALYSKEDRKKVVEALFAIFEKLEIYTLSDMTEIDMNDILNSIKLLTDLDSSSRKFLKDLFMMILDLTELNSKHKS